MRWCGTYSNADVVMRDLSFNLIVTVMIMMMMIDNDDNDDNGWQWRLWRWNVAMERGACISLILVIDRKDFEQAYTVGH